MFNRPSLRNLVHRFQNNVQTLCRGVAQYRSLKLVGNFRKAAHTAAPGSAGFQPASTEQQFRQMPPGWRRSQAEAASLSERYCNMCGDMKTALPFFFHHGQSGINSRLLQEYCRAMVQFCASSG